MAKVSARGLDALDRRSAGYLALKKWREELVNDLGGEENLTAQVRLLVEIITRSKLFLDNVDLFLMEQSSVVNRKRKAMLPLLRERQSLANSILNQLSQLGLERKEKRVESLPEFLAQYDKEKEGHEHHRSDGEPEGIREDVPEEGAVPEVGHVG